MADRNALVVDDHPTNRLLATTLLRKLGWDPKEADNGEAALVLAAQNNFRLVLLDISMPGISGEETCTRLREMQGATWGLKPQACHNSRIASPDEVTTSSGFISRVFCGNK